MITYKGMSKISLDKTRNDTYVEIILFLNIFKSMSIINILAFIWNWYLI